MRRREVLIGLPAALAAATAARAQSPSVEMLVRRQALELSARPYRAPSRALPRLLAGLNYDGYRQIRFRREAAVWRDQGLPFQLQMFHRGGLYKTPVELFEVADGEVQAIPYRPDAFTTGKLDASGFPADLGFAGFRIHARINDPERFDEFAVFLGASYFRAVSKGAAYGLSARGIELGSGRPGEEFPAFRAFWIERPKPGDASIVVHALLDGPSVAGAYRFVITPGETTLFEVDATLIPRTPLRAGIAPLTSMYLFGPEQPRRFDDFRPEVHDSDGLLVDHAGGERLWRPLANPNAPVQTSPFADAAPRGFGLIQRQRGLAAYEDLEAHYHRRPSLWVEPVSGFTDGAATLVELPARSEGEDNILAAWRPGKALSPHREHRFRYRLHWSADPVPASPLAAVSLWRDGAGGGGSRRFVVEFSPLAALQDAAAEVAADAGQVRHVTLQRNPASGAQRLSFEFVPGRAPVAELRARLVREGAAVSETWAHRWLA